MNISRPAGRSQSILSEASLCGERLHALGFGADQIRTLVSIATDSSHRAIMGKTVSSRFSQLFLIGPFSYFQVAMAHIRAWMGSKFGWIRPQTTELAVLEGLKKIP